MKKYLYAALCPVFCLTLCLSLSACGWEFIGRQLSQCVLPDESAVEAETAETEVIETEIPDPDVPVPNLMDGEVVLFENDDCSLTVLEMDDALPDRLTFDVALENKSDQAMRFYSDCFAVNGWQVDFEYEKIVEAGETLRDTIAYYEPHYSAVRLGCADEVSFYWEVKSAVNYMMPETIDDMFTFRVSDKTNFRIEERSIFENETVIIDDEDYSFVLMYIDNNSFWGKDVLFYLENRTDTGAIFSWHDAAINRWRIDSAFSEPVMPGCRTCYRCTFDEDLIALCGIEQVEELFFLYTIQDFDHEYIRYDEVSVYPTGLTSADIPAAERTKKAGEIVLLDDDVCTVIVEPITFKNDAYTCCVYVSNRFGSRLTFNVSDTVVNGDTRMYTIEGRILPAGSSLCFPISFSASDLDEHGIDRLNSMEFLLQVDHLSDTPTEPILDETVTVRWPAQTSGQ